MNVDLEILMPVHNEERILPKLISDINSNIDNKFSYKIIICEDGSSDNSLDVINKLKNDYPIQLITSPIKKGYSNAVLDGLKEASSNFVLIMDSDGQSNPEEILNFWQHRNKADIINGNRVKRNDYMYRKMYSKIAFIIYKILFNLNIKDPSYAFILVNKLVYSKLCSFKPEMPDGFFWEFNARAAREGFNFWNLDVVHNKRIYGETRIYNLINLPKVSFNNFVGMIKVKFFT